MKVKVLLIMFFIPLVIFAQAGKPVLDITDASITAASGTVNWTNDNVYLLDGFVYVEAPAELHIEAGTIIKAKETPTTGDIATALIITRGAKIYAEGSQNAPIIFTTENDDTDLPDDGTDPMVDFTVDRGLWGGVVLLGNAVLNVAAEKVVEGLPANEERAKYGGNDDADNSGVMRYVSIRYSGITVEANKELQGLTLGCVGSGTTLEYIESFNSADDGFEFFGGTVNTKYFVSAFCEDDAFDYDQGLRGKHQFWFGIQAPNAGDHIGEWDGGDEGALTNTPLSLPVIYNATFLGRGSGAAGSDATMRIKEYGGVEFYNSIVTDFSENGVEVESGDGETSFTRFQNGQVLFENNIWYKDGNAFTDFIPDAFMQTYLNDVNNSNVTVDPQLQGISRIADFGLDPRPAEGSPAFTMNRKPIPEGDDFYESADYIGAFGYDLWINGWTALYQNNIVFSGKNKNVVDITDASITAASGTVNWTNDNVYLLDGFVYVEAPAELHIEAGTIIKAKETPTTGDIATALIITRGAKIYAEGSQNAPIIFTTENDDTDLPDDGTDPMVDFTVDRGLWGGVVLLGNAVLNVAAEKVVEGLPANEERAKYGGNDDADNSGVMRYVSIRYSGITVEANKELQGLTLGCVGSGTTLEYIESFNSADDGFEFFGGTVNTKYFVSAFCEDDAFDYDQGLRGKHQFWFGIQAPNAGDHIGEWDGGDEGALTNTPLSLPVIYNATFLGRGSGAAGSDATMRIKEYGGVEFYNSIVTDFSENGVEVESGDGETSFTRFQNGQVLFENNIWYKDGDAFTDFIPDDFMQTYLGDATNMNVTSNPLLVGISRIADFGLDPRPTWGSPALSMAKKALPEGDDFFEETGYIGAFGDNLWINGWTALYQNNIVSRTITDVDEEKLNTIPSDYNLSQNYPNPFNPATQIQFSITQPGFVRLTVYNILGQVVENLINEFRNAGTYNITWNANNLPSGIYIYSLQSGSQTIVKKMTLLK